MLYDLSVVICSYNGAVGVDRCLKALAAQTVSSRLEIIVVDDGSTDNTSEVARAHGAILVRHAVNSGIASARNSGVHVASASTVAFLDDDCEPEQKWAERLIAGYDDGIAGVGGTIVPVAEPGRIIGYLRRNNPLKPLELDLAKSGTVPYRLYLYLRRQWSVEELFERRYVYSFAGANMSFQRQLIIDVGGFDERFRFGAEEVDLCMRLARKFPSYRLAFLPEVRVLHHFEPSLRDTLRRSRGYGRGSARLYHKWPSVRPTFFPGPLLVAALLTASIYQPLLILPTFALPLILYPRGLRNAVADRRSASLPDAYVQLAQEAFENIGFVDGWWRFRHLVPEPASRQVRFTRPRWGRGQTP